ncbi:uncharacterized protein [Antedon mediterranea]|uniref:uncharacterized protein isoform X1 n=1 Tax=Antedon mediterranea TaxID=105859 RepID=UPI003AF5EEBA
MLGPRTNKFLPFVWKQVDGNKSAEWAVLLERPLANVRQWNILPSERKRRFNLVSKQILRVLVMAGLKKEVMVLIGCGLVVEGMEELVKEKLDHQRSFRKSL